MIKETKLDEHGATITAETRFNGCTFTANFYSGLIENGFNESCDVQISNGRYVGWYSEFSGKPVWCVITMRKNPRGWWESNGMKKYKQKSRANAELAYYGLTADDVQKIHHELNQVLKKAWDYITTNKKSA